MIVILTASNLLYVLNDTKLHFSTGFDGQRSFQRRSATRTVIQVTTEL